MRQLIEHRRPVVADAGGVLTWSAAAWLQLQAKGSC